MTFDVRINKTKTEGSKVKAFATVTLDGLYAVRNIRVIEGDNGVFVAMPSERDTRENAERPFRDTFYPVSADARKALIDAVMDAYEKAED